MGNADLDVRGNGPALMSFAVFLLLSKLGINERMDREGKWVWHSRRPSPAASLYDCFHGRSLSWLLDLFLNEENAKLFLKNHLLSRFHRKESVFRAGWVQDRHIKIQVYYQSDGPEIKKSDGGNLTKSDLGDKEAENLLSYWLRQLAIEDAQKWRDVEMNWLKERDVVREKIIESGIIQEQNKNHIELPSAIIAWLSQLEKNRKWSHVPIFFGNAVEVKKIVEETNLYWVDLEDRQKDQLQKSHQSEKEKNAINLSNKIDVSSILLRNTHSVVIGDPGAGKSTFAKWLCKQTHLKPKKSAIIICILLREYCSVVQTNPKFTILEFFVTYNCGSSSRYRDIKSVKEFFENDANPFGLIVFDGWEEVPQDLRNFVSLQISQLRGQFSTIVTCRPGVALSIITQEIDVVCKIGSLSGPSLRALVENLCRERWKSGESKGILRRLETDKRLQALARNPLLLTMICQIATMGHADGGNKIDKFAIIQRVVELLVCQQNNQNGQEIIYDTDLDCLEQVAFQMSFGSPQKAYSTRDTQLSQAFGTNRWMATVGQSRLLTRTNYIKGDISFVHSQIQEFLSARNISKKSVGELVDILNAFAICEEREEEWMFLFAAVAENSELGEVLSTWWRNRLETIDVFGEFYRLAAKFIGQWKPDDGGFRILGIDLRDAVWSMIDRDVNAGKCVEALAILDLDDLIQRIVDRIAYGYPESIAIPSSAALAAREVIPFDDQRKHGLIDLLNVTQTVGMAKDSNVIRLFPPSELQSLRSIIRDTGKIFYERCEAMMALFGYQDSESQIDVTSILEDPKCWEPDTHDEHLFSHAIKSATCNLPPRLAARILFNAFKEVAIRESRQRWQMLEDESLVRCRLGPYKFLVRRKEELIEYLTTGVVPLAQCILVEMVDFLKNEPVDSRISKDIVKLLGRCRTEDELQPIVELLDATSNIYDAMHLLKAFRRCRSRELMGKILIIARSFEGDFYRIKAYKFVKNQTYFEEVDVAWLISKIYEFRDNATFVAIIIRLLHKCKLDPGDQQIYDEIVSDKLEEAMDPKFDRLDRNIVDYGDWDGSFNYLKNLLKGLSNLSIDKKRYFKDAMLDCARKANSDWCYDLFVGYGLKACGNALNWDELLDCVKGIACEDDPRFEQIKFSLIDLIVSMDLPASLKVINDLKTNLKMDFYRHIARQNGYGPIIIFDSEFREYLFKNCASSRIRKRQSAPFNLLKES